LPIACITPSNHARHASLAGSSAQRLSKLGTRQATRALPADESALAPLLHLLVVRDDGPQRSTPRIAVIDKPDACASEGDATGMKFEPTETDGATTRRRSLATARQPSRSARVHTPEQAPDPRATSIRVRDFSSPPMRAFHMAWMAFLVCFFAWFGIAPLMPVVRQELALTDAQVGWCIIGSVGTTIAARLVAGWLCDRLGPRITYASLLVVGSLPVMGIGLAGSFASFLTLRMLIGFVGASFVITQVHTSLMFAPRCVGTANAVTAGLGNAGAGVANLAMPLLFALLSSTLGLGSYWGWRVAMLIAGLFTLAFGVAYFLLTQDTPEGSLRESPRIRAARAAGKGGFADAARDPRVWALFGIYAACFGVELTIHNVAALYFVDRFHASLATAGMAAGSFGLLAVVARGLGGVLSDRAARRFGLRGRALLLSGTLLGEGVALVLFSAVPSFPLAIVTMLVFGVFVHLSCGATFAVVPFLKPESLGSVSGIVGAGGNTGAVLAGFLFAGRVPWPSALATLGLLVIASSALTLLVRFSDEAEAASRRALSGGLARAA
jgi:NNP family nitrate/nitrite transporter-like MFS transporter